MRREGSCHEKSFRFGGWAHDGSVSRSEFAAVAKAGGKADDSVEQAILKLEQAWIQATQEGKPENAAPLFAEDAVFTDADGGTQGKAGELNEMNKVKWETAEDSDMK